MTARSPGLAATLSFVLPGLGQAALGRLRRGLLLAVPAVAVPLGLLAVVAADPAAILELGLRGEALLALLVVGAVLTVYHAAAIVDAFRLAERAVAPAGDPVRRGRRPAVLLAALLVATIGLHGTLELVGWQAYETLGSVFVPGGPDDAWAIPEPSVDPEVTPGPTPRATASPTPTARASVVAPSLAPTGTLAPTATPTPAPTAAATPRPVPRWARDGRLDLLLIGSDAGPDRWSLRTDTLIVLSVEVETGRAALFGIPRNLVGAPLPPESAGATKTGHFPGLLNALYVYAMGHPDAFPGGDARGFRAVTGAIQELVGVRLDGAIVVNLAGFVRLVDAVGGLWIDVPERLIDRAYPLEDGSGHIRLDIRPGCRHLDGRLALAYARSRRQDSDYGRMRRQQAVLIALAHQVDPVKLVRAVPDLLDIAKRNLWTTVRRSDVRGLAELAARVDTDHVTSVRFVPGRYPSHLDDATIARIRRVVRAVFDGPPPKASAPATTGSDCP
jgi:LCP family protein required for cell wall assembly